MKTIERYVFVSFLSSFLLAFLVLSFVLTIGLLVQIVGLVLDGVPASLIGRFALVSFPETLQWTIPLALLVSSVLVFSRLSADSEIAAMRACGINLFTVMKGPALFGLACSLVGAWINNEIVPAGHEIRRSLKAKVSVGTGVDLLEPGIWIDDFPKMKVYFADRKDRWLEDLMVIDYSNPKFDRIIRATRALVTEDGRDLVLDLRGLTVDPIDENNRGVARANRYEYRIKDALDDRKYTKKVKDFRFSEMTAKLAESRALLDKAAAGEDGEAKDRLLDDMRRAASRLKVEFSKRFVFAMASLCFVLVGVPLGIRAQRRESSVGMALSLGIAIGYYLVVMLMLGLQKDYRIHPEWLIWLPVAVCFGLSCRFVRKHL